MIIMLSKLCVLNILDELVVNEEVVAAIEHTESHTPHCITDWHLVLLYRCSTEVEDPFFDAIVLRLLHVY